jgi:hypothetical protein
MLLIYLSQNLPPWCIISLTRLGWAEKVAPENQFFDSRQIGFLVYDPRLADRYLAQMEMILKQNGDLKIIKISSMTDPKISNCSCLIVFANNLDDDAMITWVKGVAKKLDPQLINTPWLIICESSEFIQRELLRYALSENWYFDLLEPDHLGSLTIRMANLIRISDHIRELSRYERETKDLEIKMAAALEMIDKLQKAP